MGLMKGELGLKEQYRQVENSNGSYEEEVSNVNRYLSEMERIIQEKEELMKMMKDNLERMKT